VRGAALGLGLASLALSLLAAELWVRVFQPAPFTGYGHVPPHRRFFRYDETLGWSGRPLARGRFADRDFDVEVSLDALGHRRAGPVARPGRANLLALGDSEGWGWGVEDDEVFASVMMRDDPRLNVHNLSAPGFGTDQQLLALERLLGERPDLRVDGVVVLLNANDFDDVVHDERHSYPKPRFVLRGGALELTNVPVPDTRRAGFRELSAQPRSPTSAWNRVHLHNLLVRALQRLAGPPESPPAALAGPEQGAGRARGGVSGGGPAPRRALAGRGPGARRGRHRREPLRAERSPAPRPPLARRPPERPRPPAPGATRGRGLGRGRRLRSRAGCGKLRVLPTGA
jgi:hypothetical protein